MAGKAKMKNKKGSSAKKNGASGSTDAGNVERDEGLLDSEGLVDVPIENEVQNHANPSLHEKRLDGSEPPPVPEASANHENLQSNDSVPTNVAEPSVECPKTMRWSDVLKSNSRPDSITPLSYDPPQLQEGVPMAVLSQEDIDQEVKYWSNTLVGLVCGRKPSFLQITNFVKEHWNHVSMPKIHTHDEGYFMFKFDNAEDMKTILNAGVWTYLNRPMLLREWRPDFHFSMKEFQFLPVWIRLPALPLMLWKPSTMGKLCSCVGTPIGLDNVTARKERISFARVLVEVDSHRALPDFIFARNPDGSLLKQPVQYEWRPRFCVECNVPGHLHGQCRKQQPLTKKVWVKKQIVKQDEGATGPSESPFEQQQSKPPLKSPQAPITEASPGQHSQRRAGKEPVLSVVAPAPTPTPRVTRAQAGRQVSSILGGGLDMDQWDQELEHDWSPMSRSPANRFKPLLQFS